MAFLNPLNAELNPICHLLALLEAQHILHVSRIRVKFLHAVMMAVRHSAVGVASVATCTAVVFVHMYFAVRVRSCHFIEQVIP
jgi:hypothetical protein